MNGRELNGLYVMLTKKIFRTEVGGKFSVLDALLVPTLWKSARHLKRRQVGKAGRKK